MERFYAILLMVIIVVVSMVYVYNKPYTIHHSFFERPMEESQVIDKTWPDFLETCSGENIIENQVHALHEFS
jgi:hypothetical protein